MCCLSQSPPECIQRDYWRDLWCVGDYGQDPGVGLLRLHSTYRHDLKIYASDEGRVQMTAAAFAKVSQSRWLCQPQIVYCRHLFSIRFPIIFHISGSCYLVILLSCYLVILLSCYLVILPSAHLPCAFSAHQRISRLCNKWLVTLHSHCS